ncbi:hypothetical protein LCGC14_1546380 [marine sediment metagenome]|uniref:Uncharacterized protein n=1 Tax=marine sediment metagenome TaxID=412755 RepID=A0A0F9IRG1_9ZZZZ
MSKEWELTDEESGMSRPEWELTVSEVYEAAEGYRLGEFPARAGADSQAKKIVKWLWEDCTDHNKNARLPYLRVDCVYCMQQLHKEVGLE